VRASAMQSCWSVLPGESCLVGSDRGDTLIAKWTKARVGGCFSGSDHVYPANAPTQNNDLPERESSNLMPHFHANRHQEFIVTLPIHRQKFIITVKVQTKMLQNQISHHIFCLSHLNLSLLASRTVVINPLVDSCTVVVMILSPKVFRIHF
jgi:hypothetical protein